VAVLRKLAGGGTFDIGSWNGGNATPGIATGTLNQTGGTVDNTVVIRILDGIPEL
jgi:hypothetical protein